ncbi:MAG TPA: PRC-barrel domain-containing protein [Oscillatoriaceae cyanobacterium]
MHRSLMSMQGLPVLSNKGVRLGSLQDAYFDAFEHRILGFVVDWENDLVHGPEELLPITQITDLTPDVVTLGDEMAATAGLEYEWDVDMQGLALAFDAVIGKTVTFATAGPIGELVDILFDPQDGSVEHYEVAPANATQVELPSYMISPSPTLEFQAEKVVVPDDLKGRLQTHTRTTEGAEEEEQLGLLPDEDRVGEEDVEVQRSGTTQPY